MFAFAESFYYGARNRVLSPDSATFNSYKQCFYIERQEAGYKNRLISSCIMYEIRDVFIHWNCGQNWNNLNWIRIGITRIWCAQRLWSSNHLWIIMKTKILFFFNFWTQNENFWMSKILQIQCRAIMHYMNWNEQWTSFDKMFASVKLQMNVCNKYCNHVVLQNNDNYTNMFLPTDTIARAGIRRI